MAKKKLTLEDILVPKEDIPYEVPENWCWVKLGSIVNLERGITFPASAKRSEMEDGLIPCLRTANVQNILKIDDLIYIDKSYIKQNINKLVREGDIIMSTANSLELVGKLAIVENIHQEMTFGGFVLNIRNKGYINNKYLFYYLRGMFVLGEFQKIASQTTNIANINAKKIEDINIAIPPLAEQERIVNRVESLFDKVDKAAGLVDEARDGFEKRRAAILEKAFSGELTKKWREENGVSDQKIVNSSSENGYNIPESWSWTTVEDVMTVKGGKRLPKGEKLLDENTGFPYIKAGDLKRGTVLIDNLQYISKDIHEKIKNYYVNSGDVYITIVGACIGDVGVIPEELDGANLTENAAKLCPNENLNSKFIARYLSSNFAQVMLKSDIASATLGKLSLTKIKKFMVPLPPIEEQDEIVKVLEKILNNEHNIIDLIELDENISIIKKSILAKAFRGDLGSNDLDEESSFELLKSIL